jgi:hypothetical protein
MKCIMDMVSWMAVWIIEFFSFNASLSNFVHILSDSWNYYIWAKVNISLLYWSLKCVTVALIAPLVPIFFHLKILDCLTQMEID